MTRALLIALAVCVPLLADAQPQGKVWRIAYLSGATVQTDKIRLAAFRQGLRELGYVEGKTVVIEERYANARPERLAGLAAELARLKPDVFLLYGSAAGVPAIRQASTTIPIVFTVSADPIGEGVVTDLARPGGQVTGFSDLHSALVTKRLELLKELLPSATRIAVISSVLSPVNRLQLKDIQAAAPAFGVTVLSYPIAGPADIEQAFKAMAGSRPSGLMMLGDYVLGANRKQILELAMRSKLPTVVTNREAAEDGALMSYGTYLPELWHRSASYVDKILRGAKPGDLPIEQPTKFELVLNLKTAQAIGVAFPRSFLLRADRVIE